MLSSSFIGGDPPSMRAIRVLNVVPQVIPNTNNLSHIQEVYRNLPQLQRAILLPVTYGSYNDYPSHSQPHQAIPDSFSNSQRISVPSSVVYGNLQQTQPKQFYYDGIIENGGLYKRDGNGGGHGHGWGEAGHKSSPALSALALLGFMFFLSLMQTSLQNNRQMLAAAALNATTLGLVAGRSGHMRQTRSISLSEEGMFNKTSESLGKNDQGSQQKLLPALTSIFQQGLRQALNNTFPFERSRPESFVSPKTKRKKKKIRTGELKHLEKTSLQCLQILACKFGKSIYSSMDASTGLMIKMLGKSLISSVPRKTWTGRLMRAFDRGWDGGKKACGNKLKKCAFPLLVEILNSNSFTHL